MSLMFPRRTLRPLVAALTLGFGASASGADPDAGPSAVTNLVVTHQGANSESLAWSAPTPGTYPVTSYNIYRNGSLYATGRKATTYTDHNATNATTPGFGPAPGKPATTYRYNVAAVDAHGNVGPQASQQIAWVYHNGTYYWSADYSNVTADYADVRGEPRGGDHDIAVQSTVVGGWWQPYSGSPFLATDPPSWCMEIGAFKYMTIDLKPTGAHQTWQLDIMSREPTGDVYNTAKVLLPGNFGPEPVAGQWATYKIPFSATPPANGTALQIGVGQFVGSIAGTTLTVSRLASGINVQASSWISGPGIAPNTYITGPSTGDGGPGTYTVSPAQTAASTLITTQRTNLYKFQLLDLSRLANNVYYVDNIGFTLE